MKASVKPVLAIRKLRMRAFLDHETVAHDDDLVGIDDGGKPVRDHHDGAAVHGMVEGLLNGGFRFGVERGRRLVQKQDGRAPHERAGDGEPLTLSARQGHAVLADRRIVALWLGENEVMRIGEPRGLVDLFVGRLRPAVADVVADRTFEQVGLLRDVSQPVAQRQLRDVGDVLPVDQDLADGRIVEARNEADDGRFAGAGRADQRRGLAAFGHETDALEDLLAIAIGEVDIVERDRCGRHLQRLRIRLVALVRHRVEDFVDHPRIDGGALQRHLQARKTTGRIVGHQEGGDEGEEGARRYIVVDRAEGGIAENAGDREARKGLRHRRGALGQAGDPVRAVLRTLDDRLDLALQLLLHGEGLDDRDALDRLLHGAENMAVDLDRFARRVAQAARHVAKADQQRRRDQEDDDRQHPVLAEHDADQRDQREEIARDRGDRHVQNVADARNVLADLGGDAGGAGIGEVADAERHQVGVEAALIAGDDVVADLRQSDSLPVGGKAAHDEGDEDGGADDKHHVGALVGKRLVDDGFHDPGGERRRRCDQREAGDGEQIALDMCPPVFPRYPLEHAGDRLGVHWRVLLLLIFQKLFPRPGGSSIRCLRRAL